MDAAKTDEEIIAEMVREFERRTGKKAVVFIDRKEDMDCGPRPQDKASTE